MNSIALAGFIVTAVGAIGAWLAMPNLLEYIRKRQHDTAITAIRVLLRQYGRTGYADLWLASKLPQQRLDAILAELVASDEVRMYDDGSRKMVELRYGSQARRT